VVHDDLQGGLRWSAGGFGRNNTAETVWYIERMKNKPMRVCAKTAFVG
jgi:hypothetical protein